MCVGDRGSQPDDFTADSSKEALLMSSWDSRDRHRWVSFLGLTGLLIAAVLGILGLPPVDLHPPFHHLGIMDPLCGGTRAARYTVQGNWGEAWRYNPLGIVAVAGAAGTVARSIVGLVAGRWLTVSIRWNPRRTRVAFTIALLLTAALEIRQQMRADLLIAGT